jgi:adenylosuccinate lyase
MAWTLEWLVLPQMIVTAGRSLDLLSRCLDGLEFTGEG